MLESDLLENYKYKDALDSASSFNTKLLVERQSRLPFLDTQTNIAQVDCHIWKKKCERVEPVGKGIEYAYQMRYWKKLPKAKKKPPAPEVIVSTEEGAAAGSEDVPVSIKPELVSEESMGLDTGPSSEPTPEELSPSSDDYEMYYERKRKRQSRGNRRSKGPVENVRRGSRSRKSSVISTRSTRNIKVEETEHETDPTSSETPKPVSEVAPEGAEKKPPSNVCDFCLGDAEKKKTDEAMISCVDCGRSAHPSCLQFEGSLAENVKSYNWQCIECKSCSICGTSDNDDQLLFCDECDRGFHMYCLTPRIERPPEGRWVCHMCNKRP